MQKKLNLPKRQSYWFPDNLISFPAFGKVAEMCTVQLLKEHPVKSPQAVCAYRFASNPKLISVVLEDSGTPPLAVTVWNGGSQLLITDVNLAEMEKQ